MTYEITFKNGETKKLNNVVRFEFPKVKTILFRYKNGLCECYFTKAIEKIELKEK